MKVTLSEIKKNLQGANSGGDEAKIQISDLECKKEISIQPEQQEEKRIQKNEDSIRYLWDISKCTKIEIIRMTKGEEEEENENIFEKMKENFLNLVREIDIQVQQLRETQTSWTPRGTQDTSYLKC